MKKLTNVTIDGNPSTIVFDGDRIARIEAGSAPLEPGDVDGRGLAAVPGLVDIHAHGCLGLDTMDADFAEMAVFRAKNGTTTWLPTSMTAFREDLERVCAAPRDVPGARLPGIHLEGPHIAMSKKGAQNPDCIRMPDIDELRSLRPAAVRVTIAPELPGALEYIRAAADMGVSVTIGHTDATYDQAVAGIGAGITHATHTFNAMPPLNHREPGAVGAALTDGRVYCELIADTFHVTPMLFGLMARQKGEGLVLITDSIQVAHLPDGPHDQTGQTVIVDGIRCRFPDGTIAGSSLTMDLAVRNFRAHTGLPLYQVVNMAALYPARSVGADAAKGSLEAGKDADILITDGDFNVRRTYARGACVYTAE
ncbi:MAG: N-acetylglucosamine-6-phosphate deacetylase [Clostridia bacterium]|nr:N-acetylglucosamine-6-phosphate deacetylase [Clostridia bacterium]